MIFLVNLFFDYEKQFDRIDCNFIQNTLTNFNFGNNCRSGIRILYIYVSSLL